MEIVVPTTVDVYEDNSANANAVRPKTSDARAAFRRVDGGFQLGLRIDALFDLPGRAEPGNARVARLVLSRHT
jgi:hypothetical protein